MKRISLFLLLTIFAAACEQATPTPAPTAVPSPLPTSTPAFTSTPTLTPTETTTATPSTPMVEAVNQTVNCRYGPGLDYLPVGTLSPGVWVPIDASTGNQNWWRIELSTNSGTYCWIGSSLTQTSGDLNRVEVVGPPAGIVIGVTVAADTAMVSGSCAGTNTNHFSGTLTTNGPGQMFYHWEIANQAGTKLDNTASLSLVFHTAGTQAVSPWSFSSGCGNYVVSLVADDSHAARANFSYRSEP
jgi:hypothetical protein